MDIVFYLNMERLIVLRLKTSSRVSSIIPCLRSTPGDVSKKRGGDEDDDTTANTFMLTSYARASKETCATSASVAYDELAAYFDKSVDKLHENMHIEREEREEGTRGILLLPGDLDDVLTRSAALHSLANVRLHMFCINHRSASPFESPLLTNLPFYSFIVICALLCP